MNVVYRLIVLFFVVHLFWHVFRQKNFWNQLGTVIILILFALRLLLIK